jgi:hypothetical protein
MLHSGIPGIESIDFSGEMPLAAIWDPDQFNPRVINSIFVDNIVRTVGRTVAYDDPFDRSDHLLHNGPYGQFDELGLVSRGSDENEAW